MVSEVEINVLGYVVMVAGSIYLMDGGMIGYCDWFGVGLVFSNIGCLALYLFWFWISVIV